MSKLQQFTQLNNRNKMSAELDLTFLWNPYIPKIEQFSSALVYRAFIVFLNIYEGGFRPKTPKISQPVSYGTDYGQPSRAN